MDVDVVYIEVFLIGELSLKLQDISPRAVPDVIISARNAIREYVQEHDISLTPEIQRGIERNIVLALISRCRLSPAVRRVVEEAIEVFYA